MNISPFFTDLRSAYQAELDDLSQDSEGKDVLKKRLADKRGEIDFLVKMMELSPEMVAVVFHQAFAFSAPAVMDDLLGFEADELPDWTGLANDIQIAPWAQALADKVLSEPGGEWFLTVAATLEYMAGKPLVHAAQANDEDDDEEEFDGDAEERADAKARKEAADDWMVAQGFDRKE
ncbi:MAG: hypothetical protein H7197_08995 [Vitreoscilla sp.]|nr:hypothetical protein [Polaromonas sp.]